MLHKMLPGIGIDVVKHIVDHLNSKDIQKLNRVCKTETDVTFPKANIFDVPIQDISSTGPTAGNHDNYFSI